MRISYTACLPMPDGRIWTELNCELDVSLKWDNGDPFASVDDVFVDVSRPREPSRYVSLFSDIASPHMAQTAHEIVRVAEADESVLKEALDGVDIYVPRLSQFANSAGRRL